ncbi:MaoC family dehydratase N-terminal domain-containing protein [uncultured Enterovirga sp.]|uniref:FAS1-like dehydratase domain-containing protein n=1 Tax=uncultured Enterovirga sp. TaxID=2026352 RepID=UPI0035CB163B
MTSAASHPVDIGHLKTWQGRTESASGTITPWLDQAFRAILDRPEAVPPGAPAPLGIHWCLALPTVPMRELGEDGHPARGGFLPPVPLPRRMWAGGRLRFPGELRVGDEVERRSRVVSVEMKQGRTGPLVFVLVEHEVVTEQGVAIVEEHDIVYRGLDVAAPSAPAAVPRAVPPAERREPNGGSGREIVPSPVLLFRYSALTFNGHRIHYDRSYVTEVEGYPGLIVHGPLQATLLMGLAAEILGRHPARFEFRAERPLFDLAPFRIEGRQEESEAILRVLDAEGRPTMTARASLGA